MAKFRDYLEAKETNDLVEMDKAYNKAGNQDRFSPAMVALDKYRHKAIKQVLKNRLLNATKD